jgi:phospholipid/cholesterol/gamma-HCH transport system substrate-binding protein
MDGCFTIEVRMPSAERVQWAKIRSSFVAVSALSVLMVLVYLLSGGTWLKAKTFLRTYLPDSTGVAIKTPVLLNGVHIGKVVGLRLTKSKDPNRVIEVRLKIEEEFLPHIPEDSRTGVDSATMLGDKYIDITMGRSPRPVRPDGELHFRPPSALVKSIDLQQFEVQLRAIDQIIRDIQDGKGSLGIFVTSDQLYHSVLDGVTHIDKSLRASVSTHTRLGQFLYSAEGYEELRAPVRQLDDRLAKLEASPYLRNTSQYDQIRDQIDQVRRTLADLNAGKGAGGQLLASDAAYIDWNRRAVALIESVDALNYGEGGMGHLLVNAQAYESLHGMLQNLETTAKEFREDPQKFLRLKIF